MFIPYISYCEKYKLVEIRVMKHFYSIYLDKKYGFACKKA